MANFKYTLRKGENLALEIPVINDETGLPIDVSVADVTNIIVTLSLANKVVAKYSLVNMGVDWGSLTTSTSIIKLLVTREQTQTWDTGKYSATVTVEFDDLELTHRVYDFIYENFLEVYPSVNSTYTLIH